MMMTVLVILLGVALAACLCIMWRQQVWLRTVRRSSRMKSVFLRALSREIRTSLHSVSGLAQIVAKDDLYLSKSEKRNISEQILYNTNLITTLLDEVAIFAHRGRGGHELTDERFSPNRMCQRCIDGNRINLKEDVRMSFDNAVGDSLFVSAEQHIVELILNKLVATACKYTEQGEISVGYAYAETQRILTFYVEDTGVGIPEERRPKVFAWFDHPDLDVDSTEFDLSVARRLAEKIGGYLREDESFQHGTRMEFALPVRTA